MGKIIAASDFSKHSNFTVKAAFNWAKAMGEDTSCEMINVNRFSYGDAKYPILPHYYTNAIDEVDWKNDECLIEYVTKQLDDLKITEKEIEVKIFNGKVANTLVQEANKNTDGYLFVGSHGYTPYDHLLMGSVAEKMTHLSPIPVVIVKDEEHAVPKDIVLTIDFSEASKVALDRTIQVAKKLKSKVHLLHFIETNQSLTEDVEKAAEQRMEPYLSEFKKAGVDVDLTIEKVNAHKKIATKILEGTEKLGADLIVMGTHFHGDLNRIFLGHVATEVTRLSKINVMIAK